MRSPDYTRLAAQLPPVYAENAASFDQIDAYLGLADELNHAVVEHVEDLLSELGPDAVLRWPSTVPIDAGLDALLASYLATYDQIASWVGLSFPSSWPGDESGVLRRREFLARCARLWRRRGTPRGFLSWFSLYFGLVPSELPYLLEHYKAPGAAITSEPYTATLFVPIAPFADWNRREEAVDFALQYAPAHVLLRVCFVDFAALSATGVFGLEPALPQSPSAKDLKRYLKDFATQQANLNGLLCSVVSVVSHSSGVHLYECIDAGRAIDRLDVGLLPTDKA